MQAGRLGWQDEKGWGGEPGEGRWCLCVDECGDNGEGDSGEETGKVRWGERVLYIFVAGVGMGRNTKRVKWGGRCLCILLVPAG